MELLVVFIMYETESREDMGEVWLRTCSPLDNLRFDSSVI